MFATLATATGRRTMTVADLNIPDPPSGGPDPLMAAGFQKFSLAGSPAQTASVFGNPAGSINATGATVLSGAAFSTVGVPPAVAFSNFALTQPSGLAAGGSLMSGSSSANGVAVVTGQGVGSSLVAQAEIDTKATDHNVDRLTNDGAGQDEKMPPAWLSGLTTVAVAHDEALQQTGQSEGRPVVRFQVSADHVIAGGRTRLVLDSALDDLGCESVLWGAGNEGRGVDLTIDGQAPGSAASHTTPRFLDAKPMQDGRERSNESSHSRSALMMIAGFSSFAGGLLAARKAKSNNASSKRGFFSFPSRGC
jgi:hypothetical protein